MRILFVAMTESIHTARWIRQIISQDWDIHVFDFQEGGTNVELSGVTSYTVLPVPKENQLSSWKSDYPFRRGYGFARRNLPSIIKQRVFPPRMDSFLKLIGKLKPDILHSLEMQHQSYPLLEAKNRLGGQFQMPWIYSSWGSDIYHFAKQTEHRNPIKSVLGECDYHIADCERDVKLAREMGFKGETLGVFPTAGGYDVEKLQSFIEVEKILDRKTIAVKGYEHWAGRALTVIKALKLCSDLLKNYTIEIYLADESVKKAAKDFSLSTGVQIKIIPHANNIEILKLFGRSRVSIGLSISDGTPNTMLEAMIMGAFPIQSDTVSTAEWINHGENGFLVPSEDVELTSQAIKRAVTDDEMVNRAALLNKESMLKRVDNSVIQPQVIALYNKVYYQRQIKNN